MIMYIFLYVLVCVVYADGDVSDAEEFFLLLIPSGPSLRGAAVQPPSRAGGVGGGVRVFVAHLTSSYISRQRQVAYRKPRAAGSR